MARFNVCSPSPSASSMYPCPKLFGHADWGRADWKREPFLTVAVCKIFPCGVFCGVVWVTGKILPAPPPLHSPPAPLPCLRPSPPALGYWCVRWPEARLPLWGQASRRRVLGLAGGNGASTLQTCSLMCQCTLLYTAVLRTRLITVIMPARASGEGKQMHKSHAQNT
jgi:hypothetical protein